MTGETIGLPVKETCASADLTDSDQFCRVLFIGIAKIEIETSCPAGCHGCEGKDLWSDGTVKCGNLILSMRLSCILSKES